MLALAITVAACSAGAGNGGQLEGTKWVLDSYLVDGTLAILDDTLYADAEFGSNRLTGFGGCNEFNALYRSGGRMLFVSNTATTMMACDEAAMAFEQTYLALLDGSRFYGVNRGRLTIYDAERNPALVFDEAPRNPLLGRWVVGSYATAPNTQVAVLEGTEIDLSFRITSVGGFAGCNSFSGIYGTNGNVVRVGPLATTRLACDQDVMDQETAFLEALRGVAIIDARGSSLSLTDRSGAIMVALARPVPVEAASPSPVPVASAATEPTEKPTPTPTAEPTPTPTAQPTPTPKPTAAPEATGTPAPLPSLTPPPEATTASCELVAVDGPVVAQVVYPGSWSTLTEPANLACRYFDPEPITVPADPATLAAAIEADVTATSYDAAVAAATDPATWTVESVAEGVVGAVPVTCVAAVAATDVDGLPAGTARYACLANVGTAGTVVIRTTGAPGDSTYRANAAIVGLMTQASSFKPAG